MFQFWQHAWTGANNFLWGANIIFYYVATCLVWLSCLKSLILSPTWSSFLKEGLGNRWWSWNIYLRPWNISAMWDTKEDLSSVHVAPSHGSLPIAHGTYDLATCSHNSSCQEHVFQWNTGLSSLVWPTQSNTYNHGPKYGHTDVELVVKATIRCNPLITRQTRSR